MDESGTTQAAGVVRSGRPGADNHGPAMMRVAALCSWVLSLGFGLPCAYGIWYFAKHGRVWTFLGFPTYGDGPFERIGLRTSVPLLGAFLLVNVAESVTGWLLWRRRRTGTVLAVALLPVEFVFWIGFALPFSPAAGLTRTGLVLIARHRSHRVPRPYLSERR